MTIKVAMLILALSFLVICRQACARTFKEQQLQHPRVREAFAEKDTTIRKVFEHHDVQYPPKDIYLRVFKEEMILELWGRPDRDSPFVYLKEYEICYLSGELGPKRQQGDLQVPEGFYHIDRFNPQSRFHLSLGINYPNESDRILGKSGSLGGDIFIHGSCVTIGCLPITDDKIKELYLIAIEAKSGGQEKIPVHIFPKRLNENGYRDLQERFSERETFLSFWANLKEGFDVFERTHSPPDITIDSLGYYHYLQ
jgi:murein L,D-transpeptidase YafK